MSSTDGEDAEQNNLLPCPFCGSHPEWINEALPDSHYYIRCPHCQFVMKEDRRDKVIGFWNNRTELASLREQLKQKEEVIRELTSSLTYIVETLGTLSTQQDELEALAYYEALRAIQKAKSLTTKDK